MEHARKMALVDPRLLVQALDDEMKTILDRKDLDDRTKVTL